VIIPDFAERDVRPSRSVGRVLLVNILSRRVYSLKSRWKIEGRCTDFL